MQKGHDPPRVGHQGRDKTLKRLRDKYYWPGMKKDIEGMVHACPSCRRRKGDGTKALEPSEPFELVSIDIVNPGQTTRSGHKYILTVVEAFPLFTKTTNEVAQHFVKNVVLRYEVPKQLLTDQGTEFMSHVLTDICRALNVKKLRTSPYHPECNGVVERFHGTLNKIIGHFVRPSSTDWDRWLPYALAAYGQSSTWRQGSPRSTCCMGGIWLFPWKIGPHQPWNLAGKKTSAWKGCDGV